MWTYVFPIVIIVISNTLYNVCQKSTPQEANPFSALAVTYFTSAVVAALSFTFYESAFGFVESLRQLNWTSLVLGVAIVGLEFGYLMAYRVGWNISVGSLVANIFLALMLIPVGIVFFKEGFGMAKITGVMFCITGLVLINKKKHANAPEA